MPHYGELRQKQLVRLLDLISKVSLTLEQSGSILASLDSRIWDGVSLQRLKSSLADQTVEASDQVEIVGEKTTKLYSNFSVPDSRMVASSGEG